MVQLKFIEIRDKATMIPAMAVALTGSDDPLVRRAGFGSERYIILSRLEGGKSNYDPFQWGDRTMQQTHLYLVQFWDIVRNGAVVDVEFILGETTGPKVSEVQR